MVSKKQINEWLPHAYATFCHYMPVDNMPMPKPFIANEKEYESLRAKIIEATGCIQKNFSLQEVDPAMEYIHGNTGNAILIRQIAVPDPKKHNHAFEMFCHFVWHELGHFFAIRNEENNLHRYNDPVLTKDATHPTESDDAYMPLATDQLPWEKYADQRLIDYAPGGIPMWKDGHLDYSDDRIKQEGYWFWSEFIAESTALYVSEMNRKWGNSDNYHPEKIVWSPNIWSGIVDRLTNHLDAAFTSFTFTIDETRLAFFFAYLLMDDLAKLYVKAGHEGKLLRYPLTSNGYSSIPADGIDTTCIDEVDENYRPALYRMHEILKPHMVTDGHETEDGFVESHEFWCINENMLFQLGSCIVGLMSEKLKAMAQRFE